MRRKVLPSAALALVDQALVSGANFLVLVAVGRCATPTDFALFALAYTMLVFFGGIHQAFVLQPLGMLLPELAPAQQSGYLSTLHRLHLLALPVVGLAAVGVWFLPHIGMLAAWTVLATWTRLTLELDRRTAYAVHDSRRALGIDIAGNLSVALGAVLLIGTNQPIAAWAGMAILTAGGLIGLVAGRALLASHRRAPTTRLVPVLISHWQAGRWLVAGSAMTLLADNLYPFLIAGYLGLRETALLAAARSLISVGNVAINGIDAYAMPRFRAVRVHKGLLALRRTALRTGAGLVCLISLVCLPLIVHPGATMELVFGPHYRDGGWILVAFAAIFLVRAIHKVFGMVLLALKRPGSGVIAMAITSTVTIIFGPLVVREFGLAGAVSAIAANSVIILISLFIGMLLAWRRAEAKDQSTAETPVNAGLLHAH